MFSQRDGYGDFAKYGSFGISYQEIIFHDSPLFESARGVDFFYQVSLFKTATFVEIRGGSGGNKDYSFSDFGFYWGYYFKYPERIQFPIKIGFAGYSLTRRSDEMEYDSLPIQFKGGIKCYINKSAALELLIGTSPGGKSSVWTHSIELGITGTLYGDKKY